jgi:uncharacterized protein YwgA
MTTPEAVKAILDCNGGRIVGRTRLQKSAYLLEASQVGYGFDFSYHYYGPYSEELAVAAGDAKALGLINTAWNVTQAGLPYSVYEASGARQLPDDGNNQRRQEILRVLDRYDAISLELAATAYYLSKNGYAKKAWDETGKRKSLKATPERVARAQNLLIELGLEV